ncbi:unnamed protein product [Amoebophrya sp. A25]|nr:unnamed protein product [Amoebophrya sp. A25]|eukprot:GSA25T00024931001.1
MEIDEGPQCNPFLDDGIVVLSDSDDSGEAIEDTLLARQERGNQDGHARGASHERNDEAVEEEQVESSPSRDNVEEPDEEGVHGNAEGEQSPSSSRGQGDTSLSVIDESVSDEKFCSVGPLRFRKEDEDGVTTSSGVIIGASSSSSSSSRHCEQKTSSSCTSSSCSAVVGDDKYHEVLQNTTSAEAAEIDKETENIFKKDNDCITSYDSSAAALPFGAGGDSQDRRLPDPGKEENGLAEANMENVSEEVASSPVKNNKRSTSSGSASARKKKSARTSYENCSSEDATSGQQTCSTPEQNTSSREKQGAEVSFCDVVNEPGPPGDARSSCELRNSTKGGCSSSTPANNKSNVLRPEHQDADHAAQAKEIVLQSPHEESNDIKHQDTRCMDNNTSSEFHSSTKPMIPFVSPSSSSASPRNPVTDETLHELDVALQKLFAPARWMDSNEHKCTRNLKAIAKSFFQARTAGSNTDRNCIAQSSFDSGHNNIELSERTTNHDRRTTGQLDRMLLPLTRACAAMPLCDITESESLFDLLKPPAKAKNASPHNPFEDLQTGAVADGKDAHVPTTLRRNPLVQRNMKRGRAMMSLKDYMTMASSRGDENSSCSSAPGSPVSSPDVSRVAVERTEKAKMLEILEVVVGDDENSSVKVGDGEVSKSPVTSTTMMQRAAAKLQSRPHPLAGIVGDEAKLKLNAATCTSTTHVLLIGKEYVYTIAEQEEHADVHLASTSAPVPDNDIPRSRELVDIRSRSTLAAKDGDFEALKQYFADVYALKAPQSGGVDDATTSFLEMTRSQWRTHEPFYRIRVQLCEAKNADSENCAQTDSSADKQVEQKIENSATPYPSQDSSLRDIELRAHDLFSLEVNAYVFRHVERLADVIGRLHSEYADYLSGIVAQAHSKCRSALQSGLDDIHVYLMPVVRWIPEMIYLLHRSTQPEVLLSCDLPHQCGHRSTQPEVLLSCDFPHHARSKKVLADAFKLLAPLLFGQAHRIPALQARRNREAYALRLQKEAAASSSRTTAIIDASEEEGGRKDKMALEDCHHVLTVVDASTPSKGPPGKSKKMSTPCKRIPTKKGVVMESKKKGAGRKKVSKPLKKSKSSRKVKKNQQQKTGAIDVGDGDKNQLVSSSRGSEDTTTTLCKRPDGQLDAGSERGLIKGQEPDEGFSHVLPPVQCQVVEAVAQVFAMEKFDFFHNLRQAKNVDEAKITTPHKSRNVTTPTRPNKPAQKVEEATPSASSSAHTKAKILAKQAKELHKAQEEETSSASATSSKNSTIPTRSTIAFSDADCESLKSKIRPHVVQCAHCHPDFGIHTVCEEAGAVYWRVLPVRLMRRCNTAMEVADCVETEVGSNQISVAATKESKKTTSNKRSPTSSKTQGAPSSSNTTKTSTSKKNASAASPRPVDTPDEREGPRLSRGGTRTSEKGGAPKAEPFEMLYDPEETELLKQRKRREALIAWDNANQGGGFFTADDQEDDLIADEIDDSVPFSLFALDFKEPDCVGGGGGCGNAYPANPNDFFGKADYAERLQLDSTEWRKFLQTDCPPLLEVQQLADRNAARISAQILAGMPDTAEKQSLAAIMAADVPSDCDLSDFEQEDDCKRR